MALRAVCGVFLLAGTLGQAQKQLTPQEQEIVDSLLPPIQQQQTNESVVPSVLTTVHGVVRNAATGEPLPRALVEIEGEAEAGTLTDGEGRFELRGVPVGPQTIKVRKPGFHDRPYATEDVSYQGDGPAHNVLVAAEMPALDFALTPTSAIHGRVELSTGDPGQGITLVLLKQVVRNGRAVWAQNGTAKTNGEGAYRFAGRPAGIYALYTQPVMESEPAVAEVAAGAKVVREGYASVFYPGAREFSEATRIRLAAGQQAEANLLLTAEPFYAVTATATLPNGKLFGQNRSDAPVWLGSVGAVTVMDATGHKLPYIGSFDQAAHTFQVSLPNGTYSLLVEVVSEKSTSPLSGNVARTALDLRNFSGYVEFTLAENAKNSLHIPLATTLRPAIQLRVQRNFVHSAQSDANASKGLRNLVTVTASDVGDSPVSDLSTFMPSEGAEQDSLEMQLSPLGIHWISTEVNDRSLCVGSFTAGAINLAREPLNVALGASPPPMELTLRDDCAKLTLQLPPTLSEFLPGDEPFYTVYVVPDFDTTADIPPMNMHASSGPTLTVEGLTPGSYHVYVFDRPVRLEYRNPAVIAALPKPGQAVTLTAGATSSLVLEVPER
jgi:hypothetical protein